VLLPAAAPTCTVNASPPNSPPSPSAPDRS